MADRGTFLATLAELERIHDYQIDAILPDGTHRYWSTHCRHGNHDLCSADLIHGQIAGTEMSTAIVRKPAQCKAAECSAPCICPCHKEASSG